MTKKIDLSVCGTKQVDFSEVKSVETPEATESWRPIGHSFLVNRVQDQIQENGWEIVDTYHSLHRFGQRYFGLFHIKGTEADNDDRGTILGLRNSHDKCFPAGLCMGNAPFVCSNLIFTNEVTLARRHTKNILNDLSQVIARTLGKMTETWASDEQRIEAYKEYELGNEQAHDLVIRAYQNGAISKAKIADVVEQWHTPEHDDFSERNMHSLYNGFTHVLKGGVHALPNRSLALHGVLDSEVGLTSAIA
tara:strand:- start:33 stop:779 length:747 start_codon:yes stop_codon:yes gene_type:complete